MSLTEKRTPAEVALEVLIAVIAPGGGLGILISAAVTGSRNVFLWDCGAALVLLLAGLVLLRGTLGGESPGRRVAALAIVAVAVASLPATGIYQALRPSPACTAAGQVDQVGGRPDPRIDVLSMEAYFCPSTGIADIYQYPGSATVTGRLTGGSLLWVVCWMNGPHSSVWYYTQGDHREGPHPDLIAWGVISSGTLTIPHQPDPAVPRCIPQIQQRLTTG